MTRTEGEALQMVTVRFAPFVPLPNDEALVIALTWTNAFGSRR